MNYHIPCLLGCCLLFFGVNVLPAQVRLNTTTADSTNLYRFVLTEYVRGLKTKKRASSTLYVMSDASIATVLPDTRRHYTIKVVGPRDLKRQLRKGGSSLPVVRILPLEVQGSVFWVRLKILEATLTRDKLGLAEVKTVSFAFRYNGTHHGLEFVEQMTQFYN
ncbi:MAG: hypothetical protein AAFW73_01815 [Bacteroidota bacterium]